jgi:hypothetical protein
MQNEKICMASAWLQRKFDASETEIGILFQRGEAMREDVIQT